MVERLSVILHLFGSRGLPTFLFVVMALLAGTAAARSSGPADLIFHLLGAALWVMFAVLVNIRPAPLRRGRSVIGVAAALSSQLAFILIGLVAGSSGSGAVLVAGDVCSAPVSCSRSPPSPSSAAASACCPTCAAWSRAARTGSSGTRCTWVS